MRHSNLELARHVSWFVGAALAAATWGQAAERDTLPTQAELIFEDRFEKSELKPEWKVKVGQWKIVDGALEANGPDAFLLLKIGRAHV